MSSIIIIDKDKDPDLYDEYANRLLFESADKYLCLSQIKYDFLSDSLDDGDYLLIHTFTYNDHVHHTSEIRGFACINYIQEDSLNKYLHLKLICNSKFHDMNTRLTDKEIKLKGKDMIDRIKELGEKLGVKYIQLDALGSVIPYYYNLGFRFENSENNENSENSENSRNGRHVEESLVKQLRLAQLQRNDTNTTRLLNEIVSKYYPGFYSEAKQREFGEGDGTRKEQAMEYGIPMIFTYSQYVGGVKLNIRNTHKTKTKTRQVKNRQVKTTKRLPIKYIPQYLSRQDKKTQREMLKKSVKLYKKGKYYTRKKVNTFKSRKSQHIINANKLYKVKKIVPSRLLSQKTGCSVKALSDIVKKGEGAYYSSGSRPNQTAQSWGIARLASAITGGKSAVVDYHILQSGCSKNSKALRLAKRSIRKHGPSVKNYRKIAVKW